MRLTRRGFTLTELIVATAIGSLVATAIIGTLVRQQRFYQAASETLATRSQLRDGADVLVADLRGSAVSSLGLPLMTDTAIEMYTIIGSSIACAESASSIIGLPPSTLTAGNTLTSLLAAPDTGDLALVFTAPPGFPDSSRWVSVRIASFAARSLATSCPASTGFTTAADSYPGATGYLLTLATLPPFSIRRGSIVRILRRVRYSLYRSADGRWYLGYRRCNLADPAQCVAVQPVSGPYRPYGSGASGLEFRYFDSTGLRLMSGTQSRSVARVEIILRGETADAISMAGENRQRWRDSTVATVSPRNRER
ncbi:MAG: prepilin-type N-terminal cleavage/methylation domain-containing protein [Gemmatimonadaceae bacterium]